MATRRRHSKRSSKRTRRHTRRSRGGRGYTTGAAAELAQMAPAPLRGSGLAFMNGGSSRK